MPIPPSDPYAFLHASVLYACYLKCKGGHWFPRSALGLCPTIRLLIKVKPSRTCSSRTHKAHIATCAVIFLSPWLVYFTGTPSLFLWDNEGSVCAAAQWNSTLNLVCFFVDFSAQRWLKLPLVIPIPCWALMCPNYIPIFVWVWCVGLRCACIVLLRWWEMIYRLSPAPDWSFAPKQGNKEIPGWYKYFLTFSPFQSFSICLFVPVSTSSPASSAVAAGNPLQLCYQECPVCPYKGKLTCGFDTSEFKSTDPICCLAAL